jgi:hypothetical protein
MSSIDPVDEVVRLTQDAKAAVPGIEWKRGRSLCPASPIARPSRRIAPPKKGASVTLRNLGPLWRILPFESSSNALLVAGGLGSTAPPPTGCDVLLNRPSNGGLPCRSLGLEFFGAFFNAVKGAGDTWRHPGSPELSEVDTCADGYRGGARLTGGLVNAVRKRCERHSTARGSGSRTFVISVKRMPLSVCVSVRMSVSSVTIPHAPREHTA